MIFLAVAAPTPGRASSSCWVAPLTSTLAPLLPGHRLGLLRQLLAFFADQVLESHVRPPILLILRRRRGDWLRACLAACRLDRDDLPALRTLLRGGLGLARLREERFYDQ